MKKESIILMTDSYKLGHWKQLPKGTTTIYSYLESRGGRFPSTIFFGLNYMLKRYMRNPIDQEQIDEAERFTLAHIGPNVFNKEGWQYILEKYKGFLPLEIKSVEEGTLVPTHNVMMTIENTDDNLPWLTNYVETLLSKIWAPITVATNSYYCKKMIMDKAIITGSDIKNVPFKIHDFGYRGVSSEESAGILDAAHLTSFEGTDTIAGIRLIQNYYNWNSEDGLPAYAVIASEHSTATPFGPDGEKEYILNLLNQFPTGILSAIMDSYNVKKLLVMCGTDPDIREKIMTREGTFVFRLDSGDPVEGVMSALDILWNHFGGRLTEKHYKLLDSHVRILQGDGIDADMISKILTMMDNSGYASDNIVFGSGGGLLQKFDRDTNKFAIKCSLAVINGQPVNVQKTPIGSPDKKSKQGRLKLHGNPGHYMTISSADTTAAMFGSYTDNLVTRFLNGAVVNQPTFKSIRARVNQF